MTALVPTVDTQPASPATRPAALRGGPWLLAGLIVAVGTAVRIPQLFHTLGGSHSFRQTQTAMVARNYAERGIDLFHTPLNVFGAGSDVPMELPLVQAIAALLVKLGLSADVAMRLVNLVSFQATALLLFALVLRWHGRRVAFIALVLLEFVPFTLLWGAAALIEFSAVALSLAMVLALDRWFTGGRWWWLAIGAVSGWLAFLVKVTTVPGFLVLLAGSGVAVLVQRGWRQAWPRVVVGGAVAVVPGLALAVAWTRYADQIKAANFMTASLTSSALQDWNFGTRAQRLDTTGYVTIMERVIDEIAGPFALTLFAGVAAAVLCRSLVARVRGLTWAAVAVFAPLVFFNLYVVHNYYLCAIVPAIAVLAALGIDGLARLAPDGRRQTVFAALALLFILVNTAISPLGRHDVREWRVEAGRPALADVLASHTEPGSKVIFAGCGWDPTYAYLARRDALMLRSPEDRAYWDSASDSNEYRWLYACGDVDPMLYLPPGAVATRSGQPELWRVSVTGSPA
ncbi:MAG TPA: glycosyltransferase family 39 protein [Candidatus Limnocylindrales bacterium]